MAEPGLTKGGGWGGCGCAALTILALVLLFIFVCGGDTASLCRESRQIAMTSNDEQERARHEGFFRDFCR